MLNFERCQEKFSPLTISVKIQMQKTVGRYLFWFSQNRYPLSGPTDKKSDLSYILYTYYERYKTIFSFLNKRIF
jgi:hypothetical protein